MLDKPQIIQTTAQLTAIIHVVIPRDEIQHAMMPGLTELRETVTAQGIEVTGPWFTHHRIMNPEQFDFEICMPVASPVTAAGRVQPSEWPAMQVARTIYHGPFEGLGEAWGEFMEWIETEGHAPAEDLWERYLTGPESSPDPADWSTELNRPLLQP